MSRDPVFDTMRALLTYECSSSTAPLGWLPDFGGRVTEVDYRGGQMLYSLADSRRAFLVDDRILNAAAEEDEDGRSALP